MLSVHVLLIVFIGLISHYKMRKGGRLVLKGNPFSILIAIYLISAIASLFIVNTDLPSFDFSKHSQMLYFVYSVLIIILLLPIYLMRGYSLLNVDLRMTPFLLAVFWIFSACILFAFIYQIPYALLAIGTGALDVREGLNVEKISILPSSVFTTFSVAVSSFYSVFIIMFFISVVKKLNLLISISMFMGGLLYVVSSLTFAARDGSLFFVLTMIFAYSIFRPHLSKKQTKFIFRGLLFSSIFVLFFFGLFSYQRFVDGSDLSTLRGGLTSYIGQQPYVFSETIMQRNFFYGFNLRLPAVSIIFTGGALDIVRTMPYEWSFGTFITDYYSMFGWTSLVVMTSITFFMFFCLFLKRERFHPISFLLILLMYFQFMSSGIFFFKFGTWAGNIHLILYAVFVFISECYLRSERRSAYEKNSKAILG